MDTADVLIVTLLLLTVTGIRWIALPALVLALILAWTAPAIPDTLTLTPTLLAPRSAHPRPCHRGGDGTIAQPGDLPLPVKPLDGSRL